MARYTPHRPIFNKRILHGTIRTGSAIGHEPVTMIRPTTVTLPITVGQAQAITTVTMTEVDYLRDTTNLLQSHSLAMDTDTGNYLFTGAYSPEDLFTVVDISDPTNISIATSIDAQNSESLYTDYHNDLVALSCFSGCALVMIDVSDRENPSVLADIGSPAFQQQGGHVSFYSNGNYVAWQRFNLATRIVDVSDPSNPSVVTESSFLAPQLNEIPTDDDVLYLTTPLRAVDVSDPENWTSLGTNGSGGWTAVKDGDVMWALEASTSTVYKFDVSTPGTFTQLATLTLPVTYTDIYGLYPWAVVIRRSALQLLVRPIHLGAMIYGSETVLSSTATAGPVDGHDAAFWGDYAFIANRRDSSIAAVHFSV